MKSDIHKDRIPDAQAVIEIKRERIVAEIKKTIQSENFERFLPMATDLLEGHDGKEVLAALLSHQYKNQLDERQYRQIALQEDSYRRDRNDYSDRRDFRDSGSSYHDSRSRGDRYSSGRGDRESVRLFIAKGRNAGMTKRLLVDYIMEHAHVADRELQEVQVMEDFSFVSAPYSAAQLVLQAFSEKSPEGKPLVTRAKPDQSQRETSFRTAQLP